MATATGHHHINGNGLIVLDKLTTAKQDELRSGALKH